MKYIDAEKLIAEIERLQHGVRNKWKENPRSSIDDGFLTACSQFLAIITSLLQEQSKFNVGDLVVSKKNTHLTYKILATNIPNELGKTDYKVEIFTDGKPDEPHNIHLISSDKIEDWGELVQQEQTEVDLEKEIEEQINIYYNECEKKLNQMSDDDTDIGFLTLNNFARHFYELGLNARKED